MNAAQTAIIEKVKKLLALAANNPSEAEAESATAKAMIEIVRQAAHTEEGHGL